MTVQTITRETLHCICDLCAHQWDSLGPKEPTVCPGCGSRAWNGTKKAGRPPGKKRAIVLPKPTRVKL
jgi:hypothetical protein